MKLFCRKKTIEAISEEGFDSDKVGCRECKKRNGCLVGLAVSKRDQLIRRTWEDTNDENTMYKG